MIAAGLLPVCSCCRSLAGTDLEFGNLCRRCEDGVYVAREGRVCPPCCGAGWHDTSVAPTDCAACGGKGWVKDE